MRRVFVRNGFLRRKAWLRLRSPEQGFVAGKGASLSACVHAQAGKGEAAFVNSSIQGVACVSDHISCTVLIAVEFMRIKQMYGYFEGKKSNRSAIF
jgi:hypothetical protein